jgi:hypothetical protein
MIFLKFMKIQDLSNEFQSKYPSLPYFMSSSLSFILFSPNFSISLATFLNSLLSYIRTSPSFFPLPHISQTTGTELRTVQSVLGAKRSGTWLLLHNNLLRIILLL